MRTCPKCNETKDLSLFNKSKSKASGVDTYCKECTKLLRRKNLLSKKAKVKLNEHEVTKYKRMCDLFCRRKGFPERGSELFDLVIEKVLLGKEVLIDITYIELLRKKFGRSESGQKGPRYELENPVTFDKLHDFKSVKYERKLADVIKELRIKHSQALGERRLLAFLLNTFFDMQTTEIATLYGCTDGFISQMITYVKEYIKENDEDYKND